jgi:predicted DNA-binding transcriptional regulator AlpA
MEQKLITIEETAKLTSMSQAWWRAAINGRKPMPPVRVRRMGGAIRLHLADLLAWIDGDPSPAPKRKRGRPRKKPPVRDDNS